MNIGPGVLWLTGLSGSGKTTLARRVLAALEQRGGRVEHLDGDEMRRLFPGTGFTKEERDMNVRRAGHLAGLLEKHGVFVIASFVSPYAGARDFARGQCRRFAEVYVSAPLSVCEQRDVKGLYARARRGDIRGLTGVDDPYEPPRQAELVIDSAHLSVDDAFARLMAYVDEAFGAKVP